MDRRTSGLNLTGSKMRTLLGSGIINYTSGKWNTNAKIYYKNDFLRCLFIYGQC
ncbi:hypothetical protein HanHA300_Chr07g0252861 [Helianthus annuus]|nr:hypothetical protein HanHA300_Chr07g0252861 [Helianthus annuus]KAJ0729358.1 hypothetical protein HanLR1_Chr07g0252011 [Helianthus annuus]